MITLNDLQNMFEEIFDPMRQKLIEHNLKENLSLWKEKYNIIKDPTWPECNTYDDFSVLPENIQTECVEVHNFSFEIWKKNIVDDATQKFTIPPTAIESKIIKENLDIIVDHNVIDFACKFGGFSFATWKNGAKSVLGFDIRDSNLTMANAIKKYYNVSDDFVKFIKLDIHDYCQLAETCKGKDTAIVPGILYHVHDHYEILHCIAQAGIANVLIETGENTKILNDSEPLVWWRTEPTFENIGGWVKNYSEVPVGYPNLAWFKMIMNYLGYSLVSTKQHVISQSKNNQKEFQQFRSVHVFKRM